MLRIFKNFRKQEVVLALFSVVFVVAQVWLELKLPDYMREITSLITTQDSAMHDILIAGGKMLLCAFGSLLVTVLVAVCASRIASNFSAIVRGKLFDKVQSFSMEEIGRFSTASLITRSTNDVTQVQMLIVMGLSIMLRAPIMAVMAILKIVDKSWQWTLSTGVAVVVLLVVVIICVSLCMPKFKRLQSLTDDINQVTRENLTGLNVVRAYNAEAYQEEKFEKVNKDLTDTHWFTSKTMAFMMPTIMMIMNGLSLAIYWIGAVLINDAQDMQEKFTLFSDMVVFSSYAMQVVMSFMMLVMIFIMLPRASVAAKRILEVLDTEPSIEDGTRDTFPVMKDGEVEFKDVSFKYPDAEEYVLEHISFSAKKGETIAFIGATGCGKSTAINLIPRFYDVTEGAVKVDGTDVRDLTLKSLRDHIGMVQQDVYLFVGTVYENIRYGRPDATREEVIEAAKNANAHEFIMSLPQGYETDIGQRGIKLSGGQKQRLSIARVFLKNPPILIFDEATSALDNESEKVVQDSLEKLAKNRTTFVIAHRLSTIKNAEKILVLTENGIEEEGTHEELLAKKGIYEKLYHMQFQKQ